MPIPGDLNNDNRVDCADLDLFRDTFGKRKGEPGYNPDADLAPPNDIISIQDFAVFRQHWLEGTLMGDLNHDGCVDGRDFEMFRQTFGKRRGDPGFNCEADFNLDEVVDARDAVVFFQHWCTGICPSAHCEEI
jgi:hypothetical protein